MKRLVLFLAIAALPLASCVKSSKEYKTLQAENDSLKLAATQTQAEFDEILGTLNEVEEGFRQIKESENYLIIQSKASGEISTSTREKLRSDMQLIAETLKNNKEQLNKLEKQLKNSQYQSAEMKKTIARLTDEINSKAAMIASLQEELAKRDVKIQELGNTITDMKNVVSTLTEESYRQQEEISKQDSEINTVWYVFGTKSELKEQKIISGGGLFQSAKVLQDDFNKDYFIKTDLRKLKEIPLYAKKAKVLSNQPEGSYSFKEEKDDKGQKNVTLVIDNPKEFWSLSKYLVIQVD